MPTARDVAARTSLISSRWLACICRCGRSVPSCPWPRCRSCHPSSARRIHAHERHCPTKGRHDLNASAATARRRPPCGTSLVASLCPDGRNVDRRGHVVDHGVSMACTPLFLNAEPHSIGVISWAIVRARSADLISARQLAVPSTVHQFSLASPRPPPSSRATRRRARPARAECRIGELHP